MTNWSDTPPTVAGTYWVRRRSDGEEQIGTLDGESWYFKWPYEDWFPANNPEQFQFGYRIPTNGEMSQIDRERHALCEVATLCMNTRAIMPEFRDISDYTEVVDILGAFLERLKELPGLIQQFADSGYEARDGESGEAGHRDYCQHGRERAAMTNWSDTPPTKAGTYWVRRRSDGEEQIGTLDGESWYFKWPYED